MVCCSAFGCKNRGGAISKSKGITFHRFPHRVKLHKRFKQWVWNLRWKNWTPSPSAVVCSDHFSSSCFNRSGSTVRLKPFAIPTIFSFPGSSCKKENDYVRPYKTRVRSVRPKVCSSENTESQDTPPLDKRESSPSRILITKDPLHPPRQYSRVKQPSKMFYRNEAGGFWMEFHLNSPVLSCMVPNSNNSQTEGSTSSHASSSTLEASTSNPKLAASDDDSDSDDDEDPAALLANRKTSQLMKLLWKYRKKNRIPSDLSQMHPSSLRNTKWKAGCVHVDDDRTQQSVQDTISHEEKTTLPQDDPQVIVINGVRYVSVPYLDEGALVQYILKEAMNQTKENLCQIVYNFCVIHNLARPASWNVNQSADMEWLNAFIKRHSDVFCANFPSQKKEEKPHINKTVPKGQGKDFLIYLLPISTVDKTIESSEIQNPASDHSYAATFDKSFVNT